MGNGNIPTEEEYNKEAQAMRALGEKHDYIGLQPYFTKYRKLFVANPTNRICQKLYVVSKEQYAFAMCHQPEPNPELLELSLRYYTQLTFEMPATEQFKINAESIEIMLRTYYQDIGAKLDYDELETALEIYTAYAEERPEMPAYTRLRDWVESQYAFALARQDDVELNKKALELYKDLAKRHPEEPLHANNRDIVKRQIKKNKKGLFS